MWVKINNQYHPKKFFFFLSVSEAWHSLLCQNTILHTALDLHKSNLGFHRTWIRLLNTRRISETSEHFSGGLLYKCFLCFGSLFVFVYFAWKFFIGLIFLWVVVVLVDCFGCLFWLGFFFFIPFFFYFLMKAGFLLWSISLLILISGLC